MKCFICMLSKYLIAIWLWRGISETNAYPVNISQYERTNLCNQSLALMYKRVNLTTALWGITLSVGIPASVDPVLFKINNKTNTVTGGLVYIIHQKMQTVGKFLIDYVVLSDSDVNSTAKLKNALHHVDFYGEPFTDTLRIRNFGLGFTQSVVDNSLVLITVQERDLTGSLWKFLSPFSRQLWLFIFGLIFCHTIGYYFIESTVAKEEEVITLFDGFYYMWGTFTGGYGPLPTKRSTMLLNMGYFFFMFMLLTTYTANLTSCLIVGFSGRLSSMSSANSHNAKICIISDPFVEAIIANSYPNIRLVTYDSSDVTTVPELFAKLRSNKCDGVVTTMINWQINSMLTEANPHCNLIFVESFRPFSGSFAYLLDYGKYCTSLISSVFDGIIVSMNADGSLDELIDNYLIQNVQNKFCQSNGLFAQSLADSSSSYASAVAIPSSDASDISEESLALDNSVSATNDLSLLSMSDLYLNHKQQLQYHDPYPYPYNDREQAMDAIIAQPAKGTSSTASSSSSSSSSNNNNGGSIQSLQMSVTNVSGVFVVYILFVFVALVRWFYERHIRIFKYGIGKLDDMQKTEVQKDINLKYLALATRKDYHRTIEDSNNHNSDKSNASNTKKDKRYQKGKSRGSLRKSILSSLRMSSNSITNSLRSLQRRSSMTEGNSSKDIFHNQTAIDDGNNHHNASYLDGTEEYYHHQQQQMMYRHNGQLRVTLCGVFGLPKEYIETIVYIKIWTTSMKKKLLVCSRKCDYDEEYYLAHSHHHRHHHHHHHHQHHHHSSHHQHSHGSNDLLEDPHNSIIVSPSSADASPDSHLGGSSSSSRGIGSPHSASNEVTPTVTAYFDEYVCSIDVDDMSTEYLNVEVVYEYDDSEWSHFTNSIGFGRVSCSSIFANKRNNKVILIEQEQFAYHDSRSKAEVSTLAINKAIGLGPNQIRSAAHGLSMPQKPEKMQFSMNFVLDKPSWSSSNNNNINKNTASIVTPTKVEEIKSEEIEIHQMVYPIKLMIQFDSIPEISNE